MRRKKHISTLFQISSIHLGRNLLTYSYNIRHSSKLSPNLLIRSSYVQKYFEQVWHTELVKKFINVGLPFNISKFIHSYFTDKTTVRPFHPLAEVSQDFVLIHLLYLIYTHDISHPNYLFYAVYTALLSVSS